MPRLTLLAAMTALMLLAAACGNGEGKPDTDANGSNADSTSNSTNTDTGGGQLAARVDELSRRCDELDRAVEASGADADTRQSLKGSIDGMRRGLARWRQSLPDSNGPLTEGQKSMLNRFERELDRLAHRIRQASGSDTPDAAAAVDKADVEADLDAVDAKLNELEGSESNADKRFVTVTRPYAAAMRKQLANWDTYDPGQKQGVAQSVTQLKRRVEEYDQ
jgi:hypothetical protein